MRRGIYLGSGLKDTIALKAFFNCNFIQNRFFGTTRMALHAAGPSDWGGGLTVSPSPHTLVIQARCILRPAVLFRRVGPSVSHGPPSTGQGPTQPFVSSAHSLGDRLFLSPRWGWGSRVIFGGPNPWTECLDVWTRGMAGGCLGRILRMVEGGWHHPTELWAG